MPFNFAALGKMGGRIAMAYLAARQAGPLAASEFLRCLNVSDAQAAELEREAAAQDAQTSRNDQQFAETRRMNDATLASRERDDRRLDEQARQAEQNALYDRTLQAGRDLTQFGQGLTETATDPVSAENQMLGQAQALESSMCLKPSALSARVPNLGPQITAKKRKQAADFYATLEKKYEGTPNWDQMAIQTGGQFDGMTPAQVRELAETPVLIDPMKGKRVTPNTSAATPGSFEDYLSADPSRRGEIETARKTYMQADDRPQAAPLLVVQTVDSEGNPVTKVVSKEPGAEYPKPPASGGIGSASVQLRNSRAAAAFNSIERLKQLAPVRSPGPLGIVQGMGEVAKGYAGYSTKTRQYQALIQPAAMQMAAAVQGAANLSDNERQAMATMLGSINTMDYESQIALLDQAVELLQNGFEVEKVNNVWRARTGNRPATPSAPVTPSTKKFEILSVK